MGFFKWLDNYARKSNASWDNACSEEHIRQRAKEEAKQRYRDSLECCANCDWFEKHSIWTDDPNWCMKHDVHLVGDDIEYKKTCIYFRKKQ